MPRKSKKTRVGAVTISLTKKPYSPWKLLIRGTGGRRREFRKTRKEAMDRAAELNLELQNYGVRGTDLSAKERSDFLAVRELLRPFPTASAVAIIQEWANRQTAATKNLKDALELFVAVIDRRELRASSVTNLKGRLSRLAEVFGDVALRSITGESLQGWFNQLQLSTASKSNYRRAFNAFFEFAQKRKWIDRNPCLDLDLPEIRKGEPRFLSVEDTHKLLALAVAHPELDLLGYFSLQLFAGLRPDEIGRAETSRDKARRLDWSDVNFEGRAIDIPADVSKIGERRYLEGLPPTIWPWLQIARTSSDHKPNIGGGGNGTKAQGFIPRIERKFDTNGFKVGRVAPSGLARRLDLFRVLRKEAKIAYSHDACRHSFATYHVAAFENAAKTALLLGHHDQQMLYEHYRGVAPKKDGEAYFAACPVA